MCSFEYIYIEFDDVHSWLGEAHAKLLSSDKVVCTPEGYLSATYNFIKEGISALVACSGYSSLKGINISLKVSKLNWTVDVINKQEAKEKKCKCKCK